MPPVISLSLLTNCPGVRCKSHLIRPQIGWIYAHPDAKMSFTMHSSHEDGVTDEITLIQTAAKPQFWVPRVGMLRGFLSEHFSKIVTRPDLLKVCADCAGWCTKQTQRLLHEENVWNNTQSLLSTFMGVSSLACNGGCLCRVPNKFTSINIWILHTRCDLQSPELIAVAVVRLSLARLKGRC